MESFDYLIIGGSLVRPASAATFPNVNPYTETELGPTPEASTADVDAAVLAARDAFDDGTWSDDRKLRVQCLQQLQTALKSHEEELRDLVVSELGCPIFLTDSIQLHHPITTMLTESINLAERFEYEYILPPDPNAPVPSDRLVLREPYGIAAVITPYNAPIQQFFQKAIPAIAAGNTAIVKPSPLTPWTALLLGKIAVEETDIPPGVLNVLTTSSTDVSEVLVTHDLVDMVTFTGSSAIGRHISGLAGQSLKKVLLELGGKSANIVLDDADLEDVVTKNVFRMCRGAGQGCTNLTRMLLPREQYEDGLGLAKEAAAEIPYGNPLDPKTHMGPLISAEHRSRVESYIAKGLDEGGRLVAGGHRPSHLEHGYFVEPTIIADVHPKSTIAQQEIFGPVLAVMPYESDDEAVAIANESQYGLSGAVSSSSLERAMKVARRVRTGTMDVNGGAWAGGDAMFGGMKQSGIGRECGPVGFSEFLEYRIIGYPTSNT